MRGEVAAAVASAVVGEEPVNVMDAVGGEPDLRPGEETTAVAPPSHHPTPTLRTHSRGALDVLSTSDDGRRDTCRARLPHRGLSVQRCDADTVPVGIGCEEGRPEPRIMGLAQDRDTFGLPLLKGRVELVGSTVDGQAHLTGARDVR